jgi:hypothetical protein
MPSIGNIVAPTYTSPTSLPAPFIISAIPLHTIKLAWNKVVAFIKENDGLPVNKEMEKRFKKKFGEECNIEKEIGSEYGIHLYMYNRMLVDVTCCGNKGTLVKGNL